MTGPEMYKLRYRNYNMVPELNTLASRYGHLPKKHLMAPNLPEEDFYILENCFRSLSIAACARIRSFQDWLLEEGTMTPAYEFHAKVLAMKEAESDSNHRWLLKMPYNTFYFPEVMQQYPKASFIWIHRDMEEVVPSFIDLQFCLSTIWGEKLTEQEEKTEAWKYIHDYIPMVER